jgi:hypothetical protein
MQLRDKAQTDEVAGQTDTHGAALQESAPEAVPSGAESSFNCKRS